MGHATGQADDWVDHECSRHCQELHLSHLNLVADVIRTHIWLKPYQMSLGDVWSACVLIELFSVPCCF